MIYVVSVHACLLKGAASGMAGSGEYGDYGGPPMGYQQQGVS